MHMLLLAPLTLIAVAAPGNTQVTGQVARACSAPVTTAAMPEPDKPMLRKLSEEPSARHIAAVHREVDGCPVMLVLDGATPGWTPAPQDGLHRAD